MYVLPQPHYERFPRFAQAMAAVDAAAQVQAMGFFLPEFHNRYRWLLTAPRRDFEVRIGAGDNLLAAVQNDGVGLGMIDPEVMARLVKFTTDPALSLETALNGSGAPSFKQGQRMLDTERDAELLAVIDQVLREAHVYDVVSAYAAEEVRLGLTALQVNTPHSTRYKYGKIGPDGVPRRTRTDYFHIDSAGWPHVKVLIYLNEVGLDQGPFRYVPGSHRVTSDFELAVRKTNDKLKTPAHLFMALPDPLRLQADFGTYMDPAGAESEALLSMERAMHDDLGSNLVLFDYHGVHRGGFVRTGARHILQCNFAPADPEGPSARTRRQLKG